jgi:hypothetical protein
MNVWLVTMTESPVIELSCLEALAHGYRSVSLVPIHCASCTQTHPFLHAFSTVKNSVTVRGVRNVRVFACAWRSVGNSDKNVSRVHQIDALKILPFQAHMLRRMA